MTLRSTDKRTIQTVNFQMTYVSNEESKKVIPAFFAGAWQASFGGSLMTMIFQQPGDRVTGQLNANSADFGIIWDGKVVDNTLRFTVVRNVPTVATYVTVGTGELVMDADGKSFKGNVLGVPTSGTFIGR